MDLARRRRRIAASIAIGIAMAACGRVGFDLLPAGSQQAVSTDGGSGRAGSAGSDAMVGAMGGSSGSPTNGGTSGVGTGGAGNATDGGGAGGNALGGTTGAGGGASGGTANGGSSASGGAANGGASAGGSTSGGATNGGASAGGTPSGGTGGGAAGTGGSSVDSGPPPVCGSTSGRLKVWSFDSTVESWAFWPDVGVGSLSWTASVGNPAPGALTLDVTSGSGRLGWIVMDAAAPDLTGHTGSVWFWLDNAPNGSVGVKLYAQSDVTKFAWADGGFVTITPKTWTCLSIDFSAPAYRDATFDPTKVVRFGIELAGTGPLVFYVDEFAY